jgi:hypothetical protein
VTQTRTRTDKRVRSTVSSYPIAPLLKVHLDCRLRGIDRRIRISPPPWGNQQLFTSTSTTPYPDLEIRLQRGPAVPSRTSFQKKGPSRRRDKSQVADLSRDPNHPAKNERLGNPFLIFVVFSLAERTQIPPIIPLCSLSWKLDRGSFYPATNNSRARAESTERTSSALEIDRTSRTTLCTPYSNQFKYKYKYKIHTKC